MDPFALAAVKSPLRVRKGIVAAKAANGKSQT